MRYLNHRDEPGQTFITSDGFGDGYPVELGAESRVSHQLPFRILVHPACGTQQVLNLGMCDPFALGHVRLDVIEHPARDGKIFLR